jgi:hypothetical protein
MEDPRACEESVESLFARQRARMEERLQGMWSEWSAQQELLRDYESKLSAAKESAEEARREKAALEADFTEQFARFEAVMTEQQARLEAEYELRAREAQARAEAAAAEAALRQGNETRFEFRKTYSGMYTNKQDRFVLREQHVADLIRWTDQLNSKRRRTERFTMSDVMNAILDFICEHPVSLGEAERNEEIREMIARDVYGTAFSQFARARGSG